MKCYTPEIAWHNRDPVFSVDIQPDKVSKSVYRLASAGADTHIVIWFIEYAYDSGPKGISKIEAVADLTHHQTAVNVVRFSPSSEYLASGDVDSVIIIWKRKNNPDIFDSENENKEHWTCVKMLRLHINDVCDLSWSPDSQYLVSGSVDNTAVLWNVNSGSQMGMFKENKGFVQGVAWDPLQKYVATLSSDRTLRVYSAVHKNLFCQCSKAVLPRSRDTKGNVTAHRLFHDDTLKTDFRRLCFSPDGLMLFAPSGILETSSSNSATVDPSDKSPVDPSNKLKNATFVFLRNSYSEPVMYYPTGDKYSVAVRCCPILFEKSNTSDKNQIFELPYKIVIAVATKSSVLFYDTEHVSPFGYVTDIHYTRLTDISWSSDGLLLVISSTDGFCSVVSFEAGELGKQWDNKTSKDNSETNTAMETQ